MVFAQRVLNGFFHKTRDYKSRTLFSFHRQIYLFTGEQNTTGKGQLIPAEEQDDAVLNSIEGLNTGLFHSCAESFV